MFYTISTAMVYLNDLKRWK